MAPLDIVFKQEVVAKIVKQFLKDNKMKMNGESLVLFTDLISIFATEAVNRAVMQTKKDGDDVVNLEHLEKILPQLLLSM